MQRASAFAAAATVAVARRSRRSAGAATSTTVWKAAAAGAAARFSTNTADTGAGAAVFKPQLLGREQALDGWRVRRLIVEAGGNHQRLLAVVGDALTRLDPLNAAIAVGRLAQAAKAQPAARDHIASDERFQGLVRVLHTQAAALPPHHLGSVVESLDVFGVKLAAV